MKLFLVLVSLLCVTHNYAIQVSVTQGILEGEELANEVDGSTLYSFKGIPYAQPPVGNLRFKAPQPVSSWEGVKNATRHGAVCPQFDILTNQIIPGNEDCLFLNIYTPDLNPATTLPVMFFIHGGGYVSGSGNDDFFGPDFIVRKNVILVTINYRLGDLGFLTLDTEEVPGNAGLKDQVLALKWVNENIAHFGGDPKLITIIGQSAGAASVLYHLGSSLTKGLFNRAIALSGVPTYDFNYSYKPTKRPYILAKLLGNDTTDPAIALEFLQSVNVQLLIQPDVSLLATESVSTGNIFRSYYFLQIVEKDFGTEQYLTKNYLELIQNGSFHDVDVYLGSTNLETAVMASNIDALIQEIIKNPQLIVPREILNQVTPDVSLEIADSLLQNYYGDKRLTV
uniref:Carboxylic ester hydrolase n=1 Tax=Bombyx mori TaxID=7091 RepID=D2KTU4_BOMMO|nr:carboxyl/cholinesterase 2 precursor [Bombyx mori]BAI66478.1 carboxyl/cholinesterase 2 [Bombyx mori]